MKTRLLLLVCLAASLFAEEPSVAAIAKNYAKLTRMTREPVYVDPNLVVLCRGANSVDVAKAAEKAGPHANTQITVFMNESAAQAFRAGSKSYPVGAVIVKEKTNGGHYDLEKKKTVLRGVHGAGGMIKRAPGFDPEHGDWEYFYFDDIKKLESGRLRSCIDCHTKAAATGYVFGDWQQ